MGKVGDPVPSSISLSGHIGKLFLACGHDLLRELLVLRLSSVTQPIINRNTAEDLKTAA
jgi:hypothetical protein